MKRLNPSNPTKVSLKSIKAFLQGYIRKFSDAFGLLELHKQEQVIWRTQQAKECYDNGVCTYCGCATPAKFYADEACQDPVKKCYPAMMDEKPWNLYKREHKIDLKPVE